MFAIEYRLPKKFVWEPRLAIMTSNRSGCAVFDNLLSSSFAEGIFVVEKDFYELEQEDTTLHREYWFVTDNLHLTDVDGGS